MSKRQWLQVSLGILAIAGLLVLVYLPHSDVCAPPPADGAAAVKLCCKQDVVVYILTNPRRHSLMHDVKRTWGRHVDRLVFFTSETDDPTLPTVLLRSPYANWTTKDRRNTEYWGEVVPHLLDLQPPAQFFIGVDDDTFPLVDRIHEWLEIFQFEHNGSFPYAALYGLNAVLSEQNVNYEEQLAEFNAHYNGASFKYPVGHLLGFSRALLEEVRPMYRAIPVIRPGDVHWGALFHYSRANLTADERSRREKSMLWAAPIAVSNREEFRSYPPGTPASVWRRAYTYHHVRSAQDLQTLYNHTYLPRLAV